MSEHTYAIKLVDKQTVATGTTAFYFEKPETFTYKAGQSVDLFLVDPPETDAEGSKRAFSLAAAPFESRLCIATRMRDTTFKRVLNSLAFGTELNMEGPFGSFTLPSTPTRACAFLVGGIGITPVRSMVLEATHEQKTNPLYLFYSNRTPDDAPFLQELTKLPEQNPFLKFVPTMTNVGDTVPWDGRTGYINATMVKEYITDLGNTIFYLCGPATMVVAMRKVLESLQVPDENIRTEEFTGY